MQGRMEKSELYKISVARLLIQFEIDSLYFSYKLQKVPIAGAKQRDNILNAVIERINSSL